MQHFRIIRKALSASVAAITLISAVVFPSSAQGIGDVLFSTSLRLTNEVVLTSKTTLQSSQNQQQSYTLEYKPGSGTTPSVVYGSKLYGRSTIDQMISYMDNNGQTFVAGINGDFFAMSSGVPIGLVVTDGILRSSDAWQGAIGFKSDGSAVIGKPQILMSLNSSFSGKSYPVSYINKARTTAGPYLLTPDFSSSTHVSTAGTDVVLRVIDNQPIRIGVPLKLRVESISKNSASVPIPDGCFVLTLDDQVTSVSISDLAVGEELTLNTTPSDPVWSEVVCAVGGGDILVNNGSAVPGLTTGMSPRSAVGIKGDGTVVFMAADGREASDVAAGMSLRDLAEYFVSIGCVSAINLDGGGSTTMAVRSPGTNDSTVVNTPSDGTVRRCANFIMLTNTANKTGSLSKLYVYPYDIAMLSGASVSISASGVDSGYYPVSINGTPVYTVSPAIGTVSNGKFTATAAGSGMIKASLSGASGSAKVLSVDTPDTLVLRKAGSNTDLDLLSVAPSEKVNLDALAYLSKRLLTGGNSLYKWSTTGNIGTIDANGGFTASSNTGAQGTVTATYGGKSVSVSVTVGTAPKLIESFETNQISWAAAGSAATIQCTAAQNKSDAYVRYGFSSLMTDYAFTKNDSGPENVHITPASPISLAGNPDYLNLWVYGDASSNLLSVETTTSSGAKSVAQTIPLTFSGWKLLSFALPDNTTQLDSIILYADKASGKTQGKIYLDQISASFDLAVSDSSAPIVAIASPANKQSYSDGPAVSATVTDAHGVPISASSIKVTLNGAPLTFSYNSATYQLTAALSSSALAPGLYRLSITASDKLGNQSKTSSDFTISGKTTAMFADTATHWSNSYVEVLGKNGVITGEIKSGKTYFRPDRNTTRAEMSAFLTRYLGLNIENYSCVELPYADKAQIPEWALPYAKAMYGSGIMLGKTVNGKLLFDASAQITRAEAMTMVGRTVAQGFAGKPYTQFKDLASIPDWAKNNVYKLASLGIVSGYTDGTILPQNNIKRSEIATILYKLY